MSTDNQTFIIQCAGCNAKLRLSAAARGKTIACPKCGKQMKLKDNSASTSQSSANKPASGVSVKTGHPVAKPAVSRPVAPKPVSNNQASGRPAVGNPASSKPVNTKPIAQPTPLQTNWDNFQFPTSSSPYQQPPSSAVQYQAARSKPRKQLGMWVGGGVAASVLMIGLVVALAIRTSKTDALVATSSHSKVSPPSNAVTTTETTPAIAPPQSAKSDPATPQPNFPELGTAVPFGKRGVVHRVSIPRHKQGPMTMNIFIPHGEHADHSLPVVLEAPAGTPLFHGVNVGVAEDATEYLPFTEAGMITVSFPLDGPFTTTLTPDAGEPFVIQLASAYKKFADSNCGVDCGKLAIDYVLQKVLSADPSRIYIWGHSSAATMSLLLASRDARIAKCIALAPITDLKARLGEMQSEPIFVRHFPNLTNFFTNGSPLTYVKDLKCPVFVAHAKDDDNAPFAETQIYITALKQAGGNVTFEAPDSGGHYQTMIEAAMPKAVEWLKK